MNTFYSKSIATILVGIALILTSCTSDNSDKKQAYISYSLGDNKSTDFARNANYEIANNSTPNMGLNIDIMAGDGVKNIYSTSANRPEVQDLDKLLQQESASNDLALIAAVKRIQELAKTGEPLTAYIVHPGTSDPNTLAEIKHIAEEIATSGNKQLKIYLLALSPAHKIPTVAAFKPIAAQMSGSCINEYSQCHAFINALMH
jgi:hypothetical protein